MKLRIFPHPKYIFLRKRVPLQAMGRHPFSVRQEANAFIIKSPKPAYFVAGQACQKPFIHSNDPWKILSAANLRIGRTSISACPYSPRAPPLLPYSYPNVRNGGQYHEQTIFQAERASPQCKSSRLDRDDREGVLPIHPFPRRGKTAFH